MAANVDYTAVHLFSLFFGVLGLVLLYLGAKSLRLKRLIEDLPTSRLKSMSLGLVEVKGRVHPVFQIKTPFTDIPCAYYRYRVMEYRKREDDGTWVPILEGDSSQYTFLVEDDSGYALVLPKDAEADLAYHAVFQSDSSKNPPPDHIVEFLSGRHSSVKDWISRKVIKVEEACLKEEQTIYLLGYAQSWKITQDSVEAKQIERLMWHKEITRLKKDGTRLKEFDSNQDGKIDAREWETAKKKTAVQVKEKFSAQIHGLMQIEHGPKGSIFHLSEKSERESLTNLGKMAFSFITAGAVFSLGSITWFLYRFFFS
ncbi:MAG: hypothetical protein HZA78_01335 [Candidatus Schekmanbacteria bacterium]|nr:hypothetical protein [Candidatus Schekmanbacteria bacterium]